MCGWKSRNPLQRALFQGSASELGPLAGCQSSSGITHASTTPPHYTTKAYNANRRHPCQAAETRCHRDQTPRLSLVVSSPGTSASDETPIHQPSSGLGSWSKRKTSGTLALLLCRCIVSLLSTPWRLHVACSSSAFIEHRLPPATSRLPLQEQPQAQSTPCVHPHLRSCAAPGNRHSPELPPASHFRARLILLNGASQQTICTGSSHLYRRFRHCLVLHGSLRDILQQHFSSSFFSWQLRARKIGSASPYLFPVLSPALSRSRLNSYY